MLVGYGILALLLNWGVCSSYMDMPQLPDNFDTDVNLLREVWDGEVVHHVWNSAALAEQLVATGTPEALAIAERIIAAVLNCQEKNPKDLHFGNYYRVAEKQFVEDLNAVAFVQRFLLPMYARYHDRLSPDLRTRLLESFRLGCDEIRRLDVAVTYTNVACMHILSLCVGGEVLADVDLAKAGYEKMKRFAQVTAEQGSIFEFNSPVYVDVTVDSLSKLLGLVRHEPTRVRAKTALARLLISMALRVDRTTGYLTGPHSRATFKETLCMQPPERNFLEEWISIGTAPKWITSVMRRNIVPCQMLEGAYLPWDLDVTTYFSQSFTFGTSSKEISRQTNPLIIHIPIDSKLKPAVVFVRYLVNDTWFEPNEEAAPKAISKTTLANAGKFLVAQRGTRAILVASPRTLQHPGSLAPASLDRFRSAKLAIIWAPIEEVKEVWVGDRQIQEFPCDVSHDEVIVVGVGNTWVGVKPLSTTDLGHDAPVRLVRQSNMLALEIYNYRGEEKGFWELERNSRFFRGEPQNGIYIECAEREKYGDGGAFVSEIKSGQLRDNAEPMRTTYLDVEPGKRLWCVEYTRENQTLGVVVDLVEWKLLRRYTEKGDIQPCMWESPVAKQNSTGEIEVADAHLTCGPYPAWLYADPSQKLWVVGYEGEKAPLTLATSRGVFSIPAMGSGLVTWSENTIEIDAIDLVLPPSEIPEGVQLILPGQN